MTSMGVDERKEGRADVGAKQECPNMEQEPNFEPKGPIEFTERAEDMVNMGTSANMDESKFMQDSPTAPPSHPAEDTDVRGRAIACKQAYL